MGPGPKLMHNFFSKNDFYHVTNDDWYSRLNFERHAAWEDPNLEWNKTGKRRLIWPVLFSIVLFDAFPCFARLLIFKQYPHSRRGGVVVLPAFNSPNKPQQKKQRYNNAGND